MAFLDEQGLQHLVDKINVRSSKTLPDNAPDGTIIIDPDEHSEGFNVSMDVDAALSATSTNPVQNKVIKSALDNKHDKNSDLFIGAGNFKSLGFDSKTCFRYEERNIGQSPIGVKLIVNGKDKGDLATDTSFSNNNFAFTGTDGYDDGEAGLVPTPTIDKKNCFLKSDGTWAKIPQTTITVDAELSDTSTNPVQNKTVNAGINELATYTKQQLYNIKGAIPTKVSELENDEGYAALIYTHTWAELQTFNEIMLLKEAYQSEYISGTTITPNRSTMCITATGAVTLDMSTIVADCLSSNKTSTIFTAYITSTADYTLTLTNAGTIKYIGSANDLAITSAGLMLNIMILKDADGNITSIVQANKLTS